MGRIPVICLVMLFCYVLTGCITPYEPTLTLSDEGILVVEGTILENQDTEIILSRTRSITEKQEVEQVYGDLKILCDNGSTYPMALKEETKKGSVYKITTPIKFDWGAKYALDIRIGGKHYQSAYVPPVKTPPVGEVNWSFDSAKGLATFYASALDSTRQVSYFRWAYEEDWEIISRVYSHLKWDPVSQSVVSQDLNTANNQYYCWIKDYSQRLILGNAENLSNYYVKDVPVAHIKVHNNSGRFTHLYALTVKQYGLTKDAYEYFLNLQSNMEQTGDLFGGQPTEMEGNIYCVDDSEEPIIGYITASTEMRSRVFVTNRELLGTEYEGQNCDETFVFSYDNSQIAHLRGLGIRFETTGGYGWTQIKCVDCTALGGTKNKPDFWPNDHL